MDSRLVPTRRFLRSKKLLKSLWNKPCLGSRNTSNAPIYTTLVYPPCIRTLHVTLNTVHITGSSNPNFMEAPHLPSSHSNGLSRWDGKEVPNINLNIKTQEYSLGISWWQSTTSEITSRSWRTQTSILDIFLTCHEVGSVKRLRRSIAQYVSRTLEIRELNQVNQVQATGSFHWNERLKPIRKTIEVLQCCRRKLMSDVISGVEERLRTIGGKPQANLTLEHQENLACLCSLDEPRSHNG